jgi:hypothetical protein
MARLTASQMKDLGMIRTAEAQAESRWVELQQLKQRRVEIMGRPHTHWGATTREEALKLIDREVKWAQWDYEDAIDQLDELIADIDH